LRDLDEAAGKMLWTELAAAWDLNPDKEYWYPLAESSRRDVLAFQASYFRRVMNSGALIAALRGRSIDRIVEFCEGGGTRELAAEDLDPEYTGEEGYWSAAPWDWILYASHESSITVGGQWLITAVQVAWPEWQRHVWTSPDFR
jgi:hypothetical protein